MNSLKTINTIKEIYRNKPAKHFLDIRFIAWLMVVFLIFSNYQAISAQRSHLKYYPFYSNIVACNEISAGGSVTLPENITLREKIAQLFIIGVTNKDEGVSLVRKYKLGGIYIKGNANSLYNREAISEIKQASVGIPLFVGIDQEGGRVQRLKNVIGDYPSAKELGAMSNEQIIEISTEHAEKLAGLGITHNFAPVLDLDDGANPIISGVDRAFSSDPEVVAEKAGAFAEGMLAGGIIPVYKHFPGHGSADNDSHEEITTTPPLEQLQENDLIPYERLLGGQIGSVMMGHLIIPGLTDDDENKQATINPDAVSLLRDSYGFNGVIISDEIANMKAISDIYSPGEAVSLAIQAGIDMPLFDFDSSRTQGHSDFDSQIGAIIDQVENDINDGKLTETKVDESLQRIIAMKSQNSSNTQSGSLPIGSSSCCSTSLTGDDNEARVWNYLVSPNQGRFQPFQAAGIMGNMLAEAHFEPRLVEYGWSNSRGEISQPGKPSSLDDNIPPNQNSTGQPGYGIVQWTSPNRKQGLQDIANERGVLPSDLGLQLDYLMQELNQNYKTSVLDPIMSSTTVEEVSDIFLEKYEIPRDIAGQRPIRRNNAKDILARYGSGTSAITGGGSCESEITGNYSLPVDREFYDQHPDWFTEPHHDYPAADIPVPLGTPIYSMTSGTVIKAPTTDGCGIGLVIDAGNGVRISYCHGSDGGSVENAREGDTVQPGQLIMHSASTGTSTGPHLHIGIKVDGTNVCPQNLFVGIVEGNVPDLRSLPTSGCVGGEL